MLEDAKQGQRLQELLDFRQKYIYKTVPAQVIGMGGSDQSRILTIDKGSKEGLVRDQPVITPDGIVGKLVEVFRTPRRCSKSMTRPAAPACCWKRPACAECCAATRMASRRSSTCYPMTA